jgi:hypothetical protein
MSEIATFSCTRKYCLYTVHIASDYPVWHPETPKAMRTLPIKKNATQFVKEYRSDAFCHRCKDVSSYQEISACKKCGAQVSEDLSKHPCAQCRTGQVALTHLVVR